MRRRSSFHAAVESSLPRLLRPQRNTEFGYSRKDVILIGGGLIGAGYALYYGLQVRCMPGVIFFAAAVWWMAGACILQAG